MRISPILFLLAFGLGAADLETELNAVLKGFDGRVGVCVSDAKKAACIRGDESFSLQSVMKLQVGIAVLDAVDHQGWRLDEKILVRREDLSLSAQSLAEHVGPHGFTTTLADLVRRAIISSDNAAADILVAKLGGASSVQKTLTRLGIRGMRIDRAERDLQTEILGISWRPDFVDPKVLDKAVAAIPAAVRTRAYQAYLKDPRDTSTPRAMTDLLLRLHQGKLLSKPSTAFVLEAMADANTGLDRLKAGLPPGWELAHKTGTSGCWQGLCAATNDVGLITPPQGPTLAIAVFVGESRAKEAERAAIIARLAAAATAHHR